MLKETGNHKHFSMYINPYARGGHAERLWNGSLGERCLARIGKPKNIFRDSKTMIGLGNAERQQKMAEWIEPQAKSGIYDFLSVGGDGTMHLVLNGLMETAKNLNLNINKFTLGMVGVGSSNDYLKNGREQYDAALDFAKACSTHIAKMTWGQDNSCYFAASASLGLTAETNHYFNHRPLWLRKLAQIHTDLGVAVAALVTLITHTPQILNVKTIDGIQKLTITNGGIVLKRSFGGAFAYSRDPTPGMLGCYFCNGLTRKQTLITMADLLKGRFPSSSKHLKMEASTLQLTADQPFMIECDGETYLVNEVTIETTQGPKICPLIKF